jgi:hypothetical protein
MSFVKKSIWLIILILCIVTTAGCSHAITQSEKTTTMSTPGMPTTLTPSGSPAMPTSSFSNPSPTPGSVPAFSIELTALPKDYPPVVAIANGDYTVSVNQLGNAEKMTAFLDAVAAQKSAALRVVQYTTEGDPIITDIVYADGVYTVWCDTTRDHWGNHGIIQMTFLHKVEYLRYVFLTNEEEITDKTFDNDVARFILMVKKMG